VCAFNAASSSSESAVRLATTRMLNMNAIAHQR
jgi:hypothetical protein